MLALILGGVLWCALTLGLGIATASTSAVLLAAALLAVPAVIFLLRQPVLGGAVLLFVLYTRISDVGIAFHNLPSIAQPLVFLLAAAVFVRRTAAGRAHSLMPHRGLWCAMALYTALLFASAVWAPYADRALIFGTDVLKDLVIVYVIVETFDTPRKLRLAIWALLVAGLVVATLTVFQAATHTYGNPYGGLAQAPVAQVTVGVLSERSSGPVGDPNFYALILVFLIPLALVRARDERGLALRLLAAVTATMLTAALVLTYSRGGLVTLVVVALLYIPVARLKFAHVFTALMIIVPLAALTPTSYWQRALTLVPGVASSAPGAQIQLDASLQKRTGSAQVAIEMFYDHPVGGIGADNYTTTYFPYALSLNVPYAAPHPHDLYLAIASETGLLGLTLFAVIIALALRAAWRGRAYARLIRDRLSEGLATSCLLALVAYLIGMAFLPDAYPRYFWLLVGLAMAARFTRPALVARPDTAEMTGARHAPAQAGHAARFGGQVLRGGLLSYGSFLASKLLVYASTVVLARVLAPSAFGLVGYAVLVLAFLDVLKNLGVTSALVYRQDITDEGAGETFVLNVITGILSFGACWAIAPLAASFFHNPQVTDITRALGCTFILSGLSGVHIALLQKKMRFGRRFVPDVLLSAVKGGVSITLALHGAGYWSLVWGQLAGLAAATVASWVLLPWIPRLRVRWASARLLLVYGLQITLTDMLGAITANIDYIIVGRLLGSTPLGLYTQAFVIPQMLTISLSVALSRVLFPAYAIVQDDLRQLQRGYITVLRYSALVLVPVGLGLCVIAPALFHTLYRPLYWPAVPALQALALYATMYAVGWNAGDVFKAIGRPDILWKMGLAQAIVLAPALLLGAKMDGIVGVAYAQIAVMLPYSLLRFWLTHRILHLDVAAIAASLYAPLIAGGALLATGLSLTWLLAASLAAPLLLLIQVALCAAVYGAVLLLLDGELRARALHIWRNVVDAGQGLALLGSPASIPLGAPAHQEQQVSDQH